MLLKVNLHEFRTLLATNELELNKQFSLEELIQQNRMFEGPWYYHIDQHGEGEEIKFPIRIITKAAITSRYLRENGAIVKKDSVKQEIQVIFSTKAAASAN